jgi:Rieske Fe-S protein
LNTLPAVNDMSTEPIASKASIDTNVSHSVPAALSSTRRDAITAMTACGSLIAALSIPLAAGVGMTLDPLLRRKSESGDSSSSPTAAGDIEKGFLPVVKFDELPEDGTPVRMTVRQDVHDAWQVFRDQPVGTIYLRRFPDRNVVVFSDICPHLGCKVDYEGDRNRFFCPCHASAFSLDGAVENKISPRPMDRLEALIDAEGQVWVRYQEFRTGISVQVPV